MLRTRDGTHCPHRAIDTVGQTTGLTLPEAQTPFGVVLEKIAVALDIASNQPARHRVVTTEQYFLTAVMPHELDQLWPGCRPCRCR